MRILTYKRTHIGDPDLDGRFGVNYCMGRVRDYRYDAVIGVGGTGATPRKEGIARKLNWVGIGPTRHSAPSKRASEVTFEHFLYLEEEGPLLSELAPNLAERLYNRGPRFILRSYSEAELREAFGILEWSRSQRSSTTAGLNLGSGRTRCDPNIRKRKCGCEPLMVKPRSGGCA